MALRHKYLKDILINYWNYAKIFLKKRVSSNSIKNFLRYYDWMNL